MAASMDYVYFPNGCLASYSTDGSTFTPLGVLVGDTSATWNYDINEVQFSQGQKKRQYKNQTIAASLTLADLNPTALSALSGGMLTKSTTTTSAVTTAPDQTIAAGWTNMKPIHLAPTTADGVALKASAEPSLSGVDGDTTADLVAGDDYYIIADDSSFSGYSIVLDGAGSKSIRNTEAITIDYNSITPVASTTLTGGSSTYTPDTLALRFYDDASERTMTIYAANVDSGGFAFGFKATDSDGVEEMALSFTGNLDTTRTSGDQLFSWTKA